MPASAADKASFGLMIKDPLTQDKPTSYHNYWRDRYVALSLIVTPFIILIAIAILASNADFTELLNFQNPTINDEDRLHVTKHLTIKSKG